MSENAVRREIEAGSAALKQAVRASDLPQTINRDQWRMVKLYNNARDNGDSVSANLIWKQMTPQQRIACSWKVFV